MAQFHLNSWDVREVREWGSAVVLRHDNYPSSIAPGYFASDGKWVKPHQLSAGAVSEHQNFRKTCRAFARVYGWCAAIYCDDTAIEFVRLESGRVKEMARQAATITWTQAA